MSDHVIVVLKSSNFIHPRKFFVHDILWLWFCNVLYNSTSDSTSQMISPQAAARCIEQSCQRIWSQWWLGRQLRGGQSIRNEAWHIAQLFQVKLRSWRTSKSFLPLFLATWCQSYSSDYLEHQWMVRDLKFPKFLLNPWPGFSVKIPHIFRGMFTTKVLDQGMGRTNHAYIIFK